MSLPYLGNRFRKSHGIVGVRLFSCHGDADARKIRDRRLKRLLLSVEDAAMPKIATKMELDELLAWSDVVSLPLFRSCLKPAT